MNRCCPCSYKAQSSWLGGGGNPQGRNVFRKKYYVRGVSQSIGYTESFPEAVTLVKTWTCYW